MLDDHLRSEADALALIDGIDMPCELQTAVAWNGAAFEATCTLHCPQDTPRPVYRSVGWDPDLALRQAIRQCASYWQHRARRQGSNVFAHAERRLIVEHGLP